jgi:hypothetical protein
MLGKSLKIMLGIAAGAAITALAVSKNGQRTLKSIGDKTADLRNSFQKDLVKLPSERNYFI